MDKLFVMALLVSSIITLGYMGYEFYPEISCAASGFNWCNGVCYSACSSGNYLSCPTDGSPGGCSPVVWVNQPGNTQVSLETQCWNDLKYWCNGACYSACPAGQVLSCPANVGQAVCSPDPASKYTIIRGWGASDPDPEPGQAESYIISKPGCVGSAACFKGVVQYIVDGDTLDISGRRIHLSLVNTPESGESNYDAAKRFLAQLCPVGSQALVDEDDGQTGGSYGRMVALVYCNGPGFTVNANSEILRQGYGYILAAYCRQSEFSSDSWVQSYGC